MSPFYYGRDRRRTATRSGPDDGFCDGRFRGRNDGLCEGGLLDRSGAGDLLSRTVFRHGAGFRSSSMPAKITAIKNPGQPFSVSVQAVVCDVTLAPRSIWQISKPIIPASTDAGMYNQRNRENLSRNATPVSSRIATKMEAGIMG